MADTARLVEPITAQEYLERERESPIRHEYVDGYMYAMAGASERHNRIAVNLLGALLSHLPDRCVPFMADMKLRVRLQHAEQFYYPDAMVCCGSSDQSLDWRDNPILVGEVLSPKTESFDRGDKFAAYIQIPTLEECILVEQSRRHVEVFRRANAWQREVVQGGDLLRLASIDMEIGLDNLYRRVEF